MSFRCPLFVIANVSYLLDTVGPRNFGIGEHDEPMVDQVVVVIGADQQRLPLRHSGCLRVGEKIWWFGDIAWHSTEENR